LGSSSTFTVTLIGLFRELMGIALTPYGVADLAYDIERTEIGIKGGKQDQYAAAFGGFNFIEFGPQAVVTPLRLSPFLIQELEYSLLLCYTKSVRESQHLIGRQIDNFEAKQVDAVTALHQIKALALEVKRALMLGDLHRFGELLHEGWEQKKLTASGITTPYIDELYEAARKAGAVGGKIAGAGGGGYILFYVPFDRRHKVTKTLTELGGQVLDFRFEPNGVETWRVYQ
jgi:D-glycero-alpha-D-manno-heptose-7-phosphate kinase